MALAASQIASHSHPVVASSTAATTDAPAASLMLGEAATVIYGVDTPNSPMDSQAIGNTGGNAAHSNQMPYLPLNFCIALVGVYPSRQ